MYDLSFLCPYHALIVGVPYKLDVLFLCEIIRYGQVDPEPVGGPTGPEGLADMGFAELAGGCLFESRSCEVWWRVDFKSHPFITGSAAFNDLAVVIVSSG